MFEVVILRLLEFVLDLTFPLLCLNKVTEMLTNKAQKISLQI